MCLYLSGMWYLCSHSLCQEQGATRGPRWTAAAGCLSLPLESGNGPPVCDALDDCSLVLITVATSLALISSNLQNWRSSQVLKGWVNLNYKIWFQRGLHSPFTFIKTEKGIQCLYVLKLWFIRLGDFCLHPNIMEGNDILYFKWCSVSIEEIVPLKTADATWPFLKRDAAVKLSLNVIFKVTNEIAFTSIVLMEINKPRYIKSKLFTMLHTD